MISRIFKLLLVTICIFIGNACTNGEFVHSYQAKFNPELVNEVEKYLANYADSHGYDLFQKDRNQMKMVTQGVDALFIAYYKNDEIIVSITNAGIGDVLSLDTVSNSELSNNELSKLANDIAKLLRDKLNINLIEGAAIKSEMVTHKHPCTYVSDIECPEGYSIE